MKKLRKGELRFIPKKIDSAWRVYDRQNGSFPYQTPELGEVLQDLPEVNIQHECDRLNTLVLGITVESLPEVKSVKAPTGTPKEFSSMPRKRPGAGSPPPVQVELDLDPEPEVTDEIIEYELEDYGDLSDKTDGYVDWKETAIPK